MKRMHDQELVSYAEAIVSTMAHHGLFRQHSREDVCAVLLAYGLAPAEADLVIACALARGLLVEDQRRARRLLRTSRRTRISALAAMVGVKVNAVLDRLAPEA
jgi:hypothetical protein